MIGRGTRPISISDESGLDGVPSGRGDRAIKAFEAAMERTAGERVRADGVYGGEVWSALSNVVWRNRDGDVVAYSFRTAGHLVAWLREEGDYMDWYCNSPVGVVAAWIESAMAAEGWSWSGDRGVSNNTPPACA